ncbi:rhamnulokinase [Streptococcus ovuberis]|uniref:Rhamnulokinase n=1 Tax=Streptococcus ovuberis TaxID=1936207 RepID=A0A7X6MX61_9STRE|nr:rhamnulokinase [Streptococcus ovuberis]NKZ20010.1 rhamnulokinase [Streptococcus ovuberis]
MTYHVAVDIGASSGRVILADTSQTLELVEIHRFKNGFTKQDGHDRWHLTKLIEEILVGLEKVKARGIEACTVGIDTWAVDYVLLDEEGQLLAEPIAYRDSRTQGVMDQVFEKVPKAKIYDKTGIQFLNFNTLYQVYAEDKEWLERAQSLLMIPDYIAYHLTGQKTGEVTNASTTQYLNIHSRTYDQDLLALAGLALDKLPDLIETGQIIGELRPELYETYDLPQTQVIAVATHDTASAVVGVPAIRDNYAYISSGTWSLIGVETDQPIVTEAAFQENYTNEWGAYQTYRFLKNITGMWAVQEIARMLDYQYSFAEMAEQAKEVEPFLQYINLNDDRFTNPDNMITEIQAACRESGQIVPETVGELVMCVYSNLALAYAHEWQVLESLTGKSLQVLHIVGGGSNVALLNQLTANLIGKPVIAGPGEATAIGNIMVQMIASSQLKDLAEARQWLVEHQPLDTFEPQALAEGDHLKRYQETVF